MTLASRLGNKLLEADCLNDLAELARLQGRLDEALTLCARAEQLYSLVGSSQRLRVRINLAFVHLMRHHYAEAAQILEPLAQQLDALQEHSQLALATAGLIPCAAVAQDWQRVIYLTSRARRLLEQTKRRSADVALAADLGLRAARQANAHSSVLDTLNALLQEMSVAAPLS
jgi:hypothetical protein